MQSGNVTSLAGPGATMTAYLLVGMIAWATMSSLAEMTTLFPTDRSMADCLSTFDNTIGYAIGWITWYSVSRLMRFSHG